MVLDHTPHEYCQIGQQSGMIVRAVDYFCELAQLPVYLPNDTVVLIGLSRVCLFGEKKSFNDRSSGARGGKYRAKGFAPRAQHWNWRVPGCHLGACARCAPDRAPRVDAAGAWPTIERRRYRPGNARPDASAEHREG